MSETITLTPEQAAFLRGCAWMVDGRGKIIARVVGPIKGKVPRGINVRTVRTATR